MTRRPGFTLIEMCAVMAALALAMLLGTALLLATIRANRNAATAMFRLSARSRLADQFRADVADADTATLPPRADGDPPRLVLRMTATEHVTYRWEDGRVERVLEKGGKTIRESFAPGTDCQAVAFIRADPDSPLITLRLLDRSKNSTATIAHEIAAILGGNRR